MKIYYIIVTYCDICLSCFLNDILFINWFTNITLSCCIITYKKVGIEMSTDIRHVRHVKTAGLTRAVFLDVVWGRDWMRCKRLYLRRSI